MNEDSSSLGLPVPLMGDRQAFAEIQTWVTRFLNGGQPRMFRNHDQKVFAFDDVVVCLDSEKIIRVNQGTYYAYKYVWEYRDPETSSHSEFVTVEYVDGVQTGFKVVRPLPTEEGLVKLLDALEAELRLCWEKHYG